MESFVYGYLEPRNAPNPTSFIKNPTNYLVPDVSIFDSSTSNLPRKNKENFPPEVALKNQVSFKSPLTDRLNNSQKFFDIKTPINVDNHTKTHPPEHFLNKELDLSYCSPKKQPSPNTRNRGVIVNKNPKSYSDWINHVNSIQKEKINEEIKEPEPTISDLYEVIKNQNNQLKNLQKQVEILLDHNNKNSSQRAIEYQQCPCKCSCSKSNQDTNSQNAKSNPVQVSIGIMTSFEINVNSNDTNSKNDSPKNFEVTKKRSDIEYTATPVQNKRESNPSYNFGALSHLSNTIAEGYSRCKDYSLSEIPEIPEPLEDSIYSSNNSIHVDIQEFAESSDEEENDDADIENIDEYNDSAEAYNNVVEQVQNILKQSPRENKDNQPSENMLRVDFPNNLQDLGISFVNLNLTTDSLVMNKKRNDLSVEVNQLVMKYLRDDQLSFLVTKNQKIQKLPNHGKNQFQRQNMFSSPLNGNEVSFATVKHMQKYRLWNHSNDQVACNIQQMIRTEECRPGNKYSSQSKILDITALKQQPKLL
ncbi:uncharacterized protein LOC123292707 [Chrysoperla carnea]|uniref:uncharacterized protein LOC123292707 n=1 Tax=Chrysoperla carnea TaxID=189513 RepID=UPI001D097E76|nr:uncharacterized protein LOC123292707 [Chrysoperla carnea]